MKFILLEVRVYSKKYAQGFPMFLMNQQSIFLFILIVYLSLVGCATKISHKGCYVADPYISGIYRGECLEGKAHGLGKAVGKDTYEGEFFQGVIHGRGVYVWSNGDRYIGQFSGGQPHGNGVMKHINGNEEAGVWQQGKLRIPE
jgi:hypothetical protein